MDLRAIEYRQLAQIMSIFLIVQFFGILLATQVYTGTTVQQIQGTQVASSAVTVLFYVGYMILFVAVLLLILKVYKGDKLFLVFEGVVVFISSVLVFLIVVGALAGSAPDSFLNGPFFQLAAAVMLAAALVVAKNKWPKLRNTAAIIAATGVGAILGVSFSFFAAFIFMIIIAVYDFIAVFVTKHMITMAKAMSSRNLAFLVGVEELEGIPVGDLDVRNRRLYQKEKKELAGRGGILKKMVSMNLAPVPARIMLGTGDLAIPLMVETAAYKVSLNFLPSMFAAVGALFGLVLNMWVLKRYNRPLPAIPLLLFGISLSLAVYFLLF